MPDHICSRCGKTGPPPESVFLILERKEQVLQSACADCWQEWLQEQTKLINELRLDVSKDASHELLWEHLAWFLKLPGAKEPEGKIALPPEAQTPPGESC